jgi:hypothetical protein
MTVVSEPGTDPCLTRLRRDLAAADVEGGVAAGLWRIVELAWPMLVVAIRVGDGGEVGVRLAVDDYPQAAPSGQPWDLDTNAALPVERWPVSGGLEVFRRDWSPQNGNAPYLPCDRIGLATHGHWATQHPNRAWNPTRRISFYFQQLHHELRAARLPAPGGSR